MAEGQGGAGRWQCLWLLAASLQLTSTAFSPISNLTQPGVYPCLLRRDALDSLFKHLAHLQADIACKANTLLLDTKCMDTRRKLIVPAEKFVPEVDTFTRTTNRVLSPLKKCYLEQT